MSSPVESEVAGIASRRARTFEHQFSTSEGGNLRLLGHVSPDQTITLTLVILEITGQSANWRQRHRADQVVMDVASVTSSDGSSWYRLSSPRGDYVHGVIWNGESFSLLADQDERLIPYRRPSNYKAIGSSATSSSTTWRRITGVSPRSVQGLLWRPYVTDEVRPGSAVAATQIAVVPAMPAPQPIAESQAPSLLPAPPVEKNLAALARKIKPSIMRRRAAQTQTEPLLPAVVEPQKTGTATTSLRLDIPLTAELQLTGEIPISSGKPLYDKAKVEVRFLGQIVPAEFKRDGKDHRLRLRFELTLGLTKIPVTEWLEKILPYAQGTFTLHAEAKSRLQEFSRNLLNTERHRLLTAETELVRSAEDAAVKLENAAFHVMGLGESQSAARSAILAELSRLNEYRVQAQNAIQKAIQHVEALFQASDEDWLARAEERGRFARLEQEKNLAQQRLDELQLSAQTLYARLESDEDIERYEEMIAEQAVQQSQVQNIRLQVASAQALLQAPREFPDAWDQVRNAVSEAQTLLQSARQRLQDAGFRAGSLEAEAVRSAARLEKRTQLQADARTDPDAKWKALRDPRKNLLRNGKTALALPGRSGRFILEPHIAAEGGISELNLRAELDTSPGIAVISSAIVDVPLQVIHDPHLPYSAFAATLPGQITPRQYYLFWMDPEKIGSRAAFGFRSLSESELPDEIRSKLFINNWEITQKNVTASGASVVFSFEGAHIRQFIRRQNDDSRQEASIRLPGGDWRPLEVWPYPHARPVQYYYDPLQDRWWMVYIQLHQARLMEVAADAVPPAVHFSRRNRRPLSSVAVKQDTRGNNSQHSVSYVKDNRVVLRCDKFNRAPTAEDRRDLLAFKSFPGMTDLVLHDIILHDGHGTRISSAKLTGPRIDMNASHDVHILIPEDASAPNLYAILKHAAGFAEFMIELPRADYDASDLVVMPHGLWQGRSTGDVLRFISPQRPEDMIEIQVRPFRPGALRLNQFAIKATWIRGHGRTHLAAFLHTLKLPDRDLLYFGDPNGQFLWRLEARIQLDVTSHYADVLVELGPDVAIPHVVKTHWSQTLSHQGLSGNVVQSWRDAPTAHMATGMVFENRPGDNAVHVERADATRSWVSPELQDNPFTLEHCVPAPAWNEGVAPIPDPAAVPAGEIMPAPVLAPPPSPALGWMPKI